MINIELVTERFNDIIMMMPEKKQKYHLKSIRNFLIHFNEIPNESDKQKVLDALFNYLEFISENTISSNQECKNLFYEYIRPVGLIYQKNANFKYLVGPDSVMVLLIILNILLFFIGLNMIWYLMINIPLMTVIISLYYKSKGTRVYQIGWWFLRWLYFCFYGVQSKRYCEMEAEF